MRYYDPVRPLSLLIVRAGWGFSLVAALGGCAGEVSFDSPDSAVRLRAIHRAAAEDDRSAIPKLIEMLESDDSAVRILSIRTLQMMTGQTLGYEPIAPSYERTPAVERWQQWYAGFCRGGRMPNARRTNRPHCRRAARHLIPGDPRTEVLI